MNFAAPSHLVRKAFGRARELPDAAAEVVVVCGGVGFEAQDGPQLIARMGPPLRQARADGAAIAGIYRADMWIELGLLCLFVVPILFLGLALRRLFEGNTQKMSEAIESTKVMS